MSKIPELTKARIFGLYLGCPVLDVEDPSKQLHLSDVSYHRGIDMAMATVVSDYDYDDWWPRNNLDYFKLILTPLSDITDEDAIAICKMGNDRLSDPNDQLIMGKQIAANVTSVLLEEPFLHNYVEIIDYLRSKSYALPYGDIEDLFIAGIAIPRIKEPEIKDTE